MKRPKGRPKGYVMSSESKTKISKTKTGQKHSTLTKCKIAASVVKYWDNHPAPHIIKYNRKIMCRTRHRNQQSIAMFGWWEDHPEERIVSSQRMKDWHTNKEI